MDNDISRGSLAPPQAGLTASRVSASTLIAASEGEIQVHLERILGETGAPSCSLQELAGDGSSSVSSMVSVWLISQVGGMVGKPKLVDLANVPPADLRSTAGIARVLRGALDAMPSSTVTQ